MSRCASGEGSYGILCSGSEISLSSDSCTVQSSAQDGIAFLSSTEKIEDKIREYTPNHKPKYIRLTGGTKCSFPENSSISLASIPASEGNLRVETFYDEADTSKPAEKIILSHGDVVPEEKNPAPLIIGGIAVLAVLAVLVTRLKKKSS